MQKLVHTLIFAGAFTACLITIIHLGDLFGVGESLGRYLLERGR